MRLEKRLEKMADRIGTEHIKLLFLVDDLQKELLELSPGKTQGTEGLQLAVAMTDLIDAARFIGAATEKINKLLRKKNGKTVCENDSGSVAGGRDVVFAGGV